MPDPLFQLGPIPLRFPGEREKEQFRQRVEKQDFCNCPNCGKTIRLFPPLVRVHRCGHCSFDVEVYARLTLELSTREGVF